MSKDVLEINLTRSNKLDTSRGLSCTVDGIDLYHGYNGGLCGMVDGLLYYFSSLEKAVTQEGKLDEKISNNIQYFRSRL